MEIRLNTILLKVYSNGEIFRCIEGIEDLGDFWIEIPYTATNKLGYNRFRLNGKDYYRHRVVAYCYLGLDITNTNLMIDHIDHNRLNDNVNNLRIVSPEQNNYNRRNVKGYYYDKHKKRYYALIHFNGKKKRLGGHNSAEEAHKAYLNGKKKFHKFN